MKLTRNAKLALIVVALMAAVGVGYTAYGGDQARVAAACQSTPEACGHDATACAGCPYAATAARESGLGGGAEASSTPRVDADKCIGCQKCVRVAPDAFKMNTGTKKAEVKPGAPAGSIEKGAKACPVDAVIR